MFTRVRWREGYDIDEVDAFIERLTATVEGRYLGEPMTAKDIRNASFTPVRLRTGYAIEEVDAFLDQAAASLSGRPVDQPTAQPVDQPTARPVDHLPSPPRGLRESPRFTAVKLREGYDMAQVDAFVDRVMATVNGLPVDRPVTADEVRVAQFSPVRIREGYDVFEVDQFLEEAEGWLSGS